MKIIKQFELPLLNVKNLTIRVEYPKSVTPSADDLSKKIADFIKTKQDLVVVKHIHPKFGDTEADVIVDVYNDEKSLKNNKVITRKSRKESKKLWIESKKGKEKQEVKQDGKEEASQK